MRGNSHRAAEAARGAAEAEEKEAAAWARGYPPPPVPADWE